jgi:hypothetical protein
VRYLKKFKKRPYIGASRSWTWGAADCFIGIKDPLSEVEPLSSDDDDDSSNGDQTLAATMEILATPLSMPLKHEQAEPMVRPGPAALAGILWVDLWQVPGQDVVDMLQDYKMRTKMALSLCKLKDRSHMPMNIGTHANGLSLYKNCQLQTRPPPSVASHLRAALRCPWP